MNINSKDLEKQTENMRTISLKLAKKPEKGETSNQGGVTPSVSKAPTNSERPTEETPQEEDSEQDEDDDDSEDSQVFLEYQLVKDREKRRSKQPKKYFEYTVGLALSMTEDGGRPEPKNYEEARNDPDWKKWKLAMDDEMGSLHKNETFVLEKRLEKKKIIDCKWIYRRKSGFPGDIGPRFKARTVAK